MARNNVAAQQQQGGGQMPTIVEVEKQKMAQQQAMQQQLIDALTSAGVGSLPTKPDMFSQGGGVVAFNGQDNEQFIQTSPEETAPPSGGGGKSIFQRVGEIFRPRNTYLQRPDNAVADQAIDIIKQVEGQIGVGDVAVRAVGVALVVLVGQLADALDGLDALRQGLASHHLPFGRQNLASEGEEILLEVVEGVGGPAGLGHPDPEELPVLGRVLLAQGVLDLLPEQIGRAHV